jgi:hypothetical protein
MRRPRSPASHHHDERQLTPAARNFVAQLTEDALNAMTGHLVTLDPKCGIAAQAEMPRARQRGFVRGGPSKGLRDRGLLAMRCRAGQSALLVFAEDQTFLTVR